MSGLICWIAVMKLSIEDLHVYMDNFFGWDFKDSCLEYHHHLQPR